MTLTAQIAKYVRPILQRFGVDVVRHDNVNSVWLRVVSMLRAQRIDLVVDVGANAGQYARALRAAGYAGRIISFEPLAGPHQRCVEAAREDALWEVAPPMGLGRASAVAQIHVAANSVSSSLRPMLSAHVETCPESVVVGSEEIQVRRLDEILPPRLVGEERVYIKIDTQGTEDEVLEGAEGVLERVSGVQVEMSLEPLYDGAPSFSVLLQKILEWGFVPWGILPGFTDRRTGRMLQVDGVFFRP